MSKTSQRERTPVGFIGLGLMGSAMAANLIKRTPLVVWNRTRSSCDDLEAAGATVAESARAVFERVRIIFVMLSDEAAIDDVLRLDGAMPLQDRTVVLMSTVTPEYSAGLASFIAQSGGTYVEAPVSGSRQPAVDGTVISMVAGDPEALDPIEPLIRAMSAMVFRCGRVPAALTMKLAVNTFLITLVTGLAESFHFAEENGVDIEILRQVLDAGPMASAVSRAKAKKLATGDWAPHAAIPDVLKNCLLVQGQARRARHSSPLIDGCAALYSEAQALGHGTDDMAAVIAAMRHRTDRERYWETS